MCQWLLLLKITNLITNSSNLRSSMLEFIIPVKHGGSIIHSTLKEKQLESICQQSKRDILIVINRALTLFKLSRHQFLSYHFVFL